MTDRRPLLLLDTASLYFRAFFGVPDSVRAPDGTPVNAVRGLLDMTARLVQARRPERLVACWDDDWRPEFRVAAIPSYKEHRLAADGGEEVPAALTAQIPLIVEVLAALGVARVGAPGYEADDVIGTLTAREAARPAGERAPVEVVTGDRDLFQLVDDDVPVRVLYTARGLRDLDVVDQARLAERYGVPTGRAYGDMSVLRGDSSDGLPGVPGIGEKGAAALLARHGTLEAVLAAAETEDASVPRAQRRRLLDAADYLAVAPAVVRVAPDAPVAEADHAVPSTPADPERLVALSERWGLGSSVARLVDAFTALA
ncbi:5'-3' exonuclease [Cellulomonas sp. APG4]|uniref:5'-3' exonuclease n=1 Tax=Cellulomonas sp. APG4 TaxID=1538656 RepID=UPI0013794F4F|nr:5'-3' exonuclease [Cellulomonas sp. APG4]NCT92690.1 5'-3' exonuclease [Cellulomonas sp. APG4]